MAADEVYLRDDLAALVGEADVFAWFNNLDGEVFRALENRRTFATQMGGKRYFVKHHRGIEVKEILKNLLQLRLPVVSARNEWRALNKLRELGIRVPEIAAWGIRGDLTLHCESFIVTEDVGTQLNLEDLTRDWPDKPPEFADKLTLLREVAQISAKMHDNGICHRDYYICHFLVSDAEKNQLTLIDLHRALVKNRLGRRWLIKDIAGLYFSAMDIGLTQRDLLRFVRLYSGTSLKSALHGDKNFWQQVQQRANRLKARHG